MCFYIHKKYPNALISNKDIYCYKQLLKAWDGYYAPVMDYKYWDVNNIDKTAEITAKFTIEGSVITTGIHAYSILKHSIYKVFIAKIPAGTKYYYNPKTQEYVSEKLIVFKSYWNGLIHKLFKLK